jgi:predicted ester cyclase
MTLRDHDEVMQVLQAF